MAVENYTPYKGVFESEETLTVSLDWFRDTAELIFLWVYPDGTGVEADFTAATEKAYVSCDDDNVLTVSRLVNTDGAYSQSVWIYRKSLPTIEAEAPTSGSVPVSAIVQELEEHYRRLDDAAVESAKAIKVPEWDTDTYLPPKDIRAGRIAGFDDDGKPAIGRNVKEVDEVLQVKDDALAALEKAQVCADDAAESAEKAQDYYEQTLAAGADLEKKIEAEATARASADEELTASIDAEKSRAMEAEDELQAAIEEEEKRATAAETTLQTNVEAEAASREEADTNLQTQITANAKAITAEATRATAAEETLQANIDKEATARESADTNLQTAIDTESTARANGDAETLASAKAYTDEKATALETSVAETYAPIESPALTGTATAEAFAASGNVNVDGILTVKGSTVLKSLVSIPKGMRATTATSLNVLSIADADSTKFYLTFAPSDTGGATTLQTVDGNILGLVSSGLLSACGKGGIDFTVGENYTAALSFDTDGNATFGGTVSFLKNGSTETLVGVSESVDTLSTKVDELESKLVSAMHYCGNVDTESDLPTEGNSAGDFYNVSDTGVNYAWNGESWDEISGVFSVGTATTTTAGLVKLGTSYTDLKGYVGLNTSGQMQIMQATDSDYGVVKYGEVVKAKKWYGDDSKYYVGLNEGSRIFNMQNKPIHSLSSLTFDDGTTITFPSTSGEVALASDVETVSTAVETEATRAQAAEATLTTATETNATNIAEATAAVEAMQASVDAATAAVETETSRATDAEDALDTRVTLLEAGSGGSSGLSLKSLYPTTIWDTANRPYYCGTDNGPTITGNADGLFCPNYHSYPDEDGAPNGDEFMINLDEITSARQMFRNTTWLTMLCVVSTRGKVVSGESVYDYVYEYDGVDKLVDGDEMFAGSSITEFYDWLGADSERKTLGALVNGNKMFLNATGLTSVDTFGSTVAYGSLVRGTDMFYGCTALTSIGASSSETAFENLEYGDRMFKNCSALGNYLGLSEANTGAFNKLKRGYEMFNGCSVQFFPVQTGAYEAQLDGAFGELTDGRRLFYGSSIRKLGLTNNTSSFSKLEDGSEMFTGLSGFMSSGEIQLLVDNLPTVSSGSITLPPQASIIWDDTTTTDAATLGEFEAYGGIGETAGTQLNWSTIYAACSAKGWTASRG